MDVVYPLSTGSVWRDNELRFSLRSLVANVTDLGRVIVVGHKPDWLDTDAAIWLDVQDQRKSGKDTNMIRKVLAACDHVGGPFVRMSDDQCVLAELQLADMPAYGHSLNLPDKEPSHKWTRNRWRAGVWLREHGYTHYDFDLHCPMPVCPEMFRRMAEETPWQQRNFGTINTMYGNFAGLHPASIGGRLIRYHGNGPGCHKHAAFVLREKMFLNYNNGGLTEQLKYALAKTFPQQSDFELSEHGLHFDTQMLARSTRRHPQPRYWAPSPERREKRRISHAKLVRLGKEGRRALREARA